MADDVLSQEEIDALLKGIATGEIDAEEAKSEARNIYSYDFKRPNKFSKDQLRTLQLLHEACARQLGNTLSSILRTRVDISVQSTEQTTYEEFIRSVPAPTFLTLIKMESLEGTGLLEMNLPIAFGMVDRLLGGPGIGEPPSRELTDIETSLLEDIVKRILFHLKEAWSAVTEVQFTIERMESRPQFAQIVFPTDIVLNVCIEISIGSYDGFMNLCFPYVFLEPIAENFSTEQWFAKKAAKQLTAGQEERVKAQLEKTTIPIKVKLGSSSITVREFNSLVVGDVVKLDQSVKSPVSIFVGEKMLYTAVPGTHGKSMAVKVLERLDLE